MTDGLSMSGRTELKLSQKLQGCMDKSTADNRATKENLVALLAPFMLWRQ
jgi:hypothetical protein